VYAVRLHGWQVKPGLSTGAPPEETIQKVSDKKTKTKRKKKTKRRSF